MNVNGPSMVGAHAPQSPASVENKRVALQAMLLRKSVLAQQEQSAEVERQAEGKGNLIDLRV